MRVLLIDNSSKHTQKLAGLFEGHHVITIPYTQVGINLRNEYDLITLSGGNVHPLAKNINVYTREMELIFNTDKPVIGVCFGFEILAYIYGADIGKLSKKTTGFHSVSVLDEGLRHDLGRDISVYKSHSWQVTRCSDNLTPLIVSATGIEAFKHIHKPHYGMQFHPEVCTESVDGKRVFEYIFARITS